MAKVISIVGTLTGKLAGTVYSHNRWGTYIRQLVIPTNPQTVSQVAQRSRIASAAALWSTLTTEQRLAWDAFATQIVRLDRLGQPINYNGFTAFMLCHTERSICAQGSVTTPPLMYQGYQPDDITFNVTDDAMTLTAVAKDGASLVNTGTACLMAYSTAPQRTNALYPKSWRHFYTSGKTQAFPITLTSAWEDKFGAIVEGDDLRYFLRVVMVTIDDTVGASKFYVSSPVDDTVLSTTT